MKEFACHKIAEGRGKGEALVTRDSICFYLVDPETGKIIEDGHDAFGMSVAGKVLIFPSGKGSSVVQADGLYQLMLKDNAPKAMVIQHPDTVLVATAIIMSIPLVDKVEDSFYQTVANGDLIEVNADEGVVGIVEEATAVGEPESNNLEVNPTDWP
jgi:predicted aconitase with swiveling domain